MSVPDILDSTTDRLVSIRSTGLVTSVGLTSAAACAAIRAKLSNPTETHFYDSNGDWIVAHTVDLDSPSSGQKKLQEMALLAAIECLKILPREEWTKIPLFLCVAERDRPGRLDGLDDGLFFDLSEQLQLEFQKESLVIPHGRAAAATAMSRARRMLNETSVPYVLIVATDSLVRGPTLRAYDAASRLITPTNSNGFMPGEGAGALLVGRVSAGWQCVCSGLGFATEPANITGELPLRGDGLVQAIREALSDAGCALHDLDFRISDLSGEQYYFKEAALSVSRLLRKRKAEFDMWQPAECIGEAGAVGGLAPLIVAAAAFHKGYAPGPNLLCHTASDAGARTAAILQFRRF